MAGPTTSAVVDASALLAFAFQESGADRFVPSVGAAPAMSAVNWAEVSQKAAARDVDGAELLRAVATAGLRIVELTIDRAERVAALWQSTRPYGLSLADRACLALALELDAPAVTADRSWTEIVLAGLDVESLR